MADLLLLTARPARMLIGEDEAPAAMDMTLALSQAGVEVLGTVDTEGDAACDHGANSRL